MMNKIKTKVCIKFFRTKLKKYLFFKYGEKIKQRCFDDKGTS